MCSGICPSVRVTVAAPPVASTAYPEPAPTTNLSCKFGVPLDPLHSRHPSGIDPTDPDHNIIIPVKKDAALAVVCAAAAAVPAEVAAVAAPSAVVCAAAAFVTAPSAVVCAAAAAVAAAVD